MADPRETAQTMVDILRRIIEILDQAGEGENDLESTLDEDQKVFIQSCLSTMAQPGEHEDDAAQAREIRQAVLSKM